MYLDQCKGFEEDAKKFVALAQESSDIQVDYDLLRPLFMRTIRHKKGTDVLKVFEQFRKTLKINKHSATFKDSSADDKTSMLKALKKAFYDGLIKDLINNNGETIANVIREEKIKDGFPDEQLEVKAEL